MWIWRKDFISALKKINALVMILALWLESFNILLRNSMAPLQ